MCGIVGYFGENKSCDFLVGLLKRLEYRGYDSAGIAYVKNGDIKAVKSVGNISNLKEKIVQNDEFNLGIAHTRWATHGKPTENNAHPISSFNDSWSIVHNGIIENFNILKESLKQDGVIFRGETDTEVIANLLEKQNETGIKAIINTTKSLDGSYALACINKGVSALYLAKNKSPLYVGVGIGGVTIASDPICFVGNLDEYYSMEDGEFCEINESGVVFYNQNCEKIQKNINKLDNIEYSENKDGYPHFMLKEIEETPSVFKKNYEKYKKEQILNKFDKDFISKFNKVVFIGCGTAYHAGLMGANYVASICRISASCHVASEYRYSNPIIDEKTLCVLVSQSGETADTLAVCDLATKMGATTIGLTNVLHSTLSKKVNFVLPIFAGVEIAVASTKAYSAQILVLYMFARHLRNIIKEENVDYLQEVLNLSETNLMPELKEVIEISTDLKDKDKVFFIGRDKDYITCEEASLKLKEISYINCSAHPAGELKHGFLALIEEGTPVFVVATNKELFDKTLNGANEAKSRGGKIILITNQETLGKNLQFEKIIKLPITCEHLMPNISIIFFQMLAYYVSTSKDINPDKPRNLAKSVTVE